MAPLLHRAGLTADADLVYRTLVSFGQFRSAALAGELSLSHGRVLTALSSLHAAGLVSTRGRGVQRRWCAETLQNPQNPRPSAAMPASVPGPYPDQFGALADTPAVMLGDELRHLTSRTATQRRLDECYSWGPKELLTISPEQRWDDSALYAAARASQWMAKSHMVFRELGTSRIDLDLLVPYGGLRLPPGAYRRMPGAPMKLIIIDRRVAFFPVDPGNIERGYLEIAQAPVVESLVAMFEKHWADAEGLGELEDRMSGFQLSPREEAIVKQLVQGHTDAVAARALHISERTVSTIVRSLMDRLDVRNRFQLGVALGRLDAAPPPPPAGRTRGDGNNDSDQSPGQRSETGR